jgi:hypothetical protein
MLIREIYVCCSNEFEILWTQVPRMSVSVTEFYRMGMLLQRCPFRRSVVAESTSIEFLQSI